MASQEAKAELTKIDTDKDGKATLAEITAYMKAVSLAPLSLAATRQRLSRARGASRHKWRRTR